MLKKVIAGFLVLATSTVFGMSLNQLNSVSKTELMEINGIGEAKAAAIMKARKFNSFDDVLKVKGVGEKLVSNIKNDVKSQSKSKKSTKS
ncbi:MAG: helix-hairpin-helix domain-containing protein [Sulfurovum sp.]|nr:MAG: helix-hairpin-helix domain-containing protein [Sulfurovum sp.]